MTYVLDNTVLSHFARAGRLDVLEGMLAGSRCLAPHQVRTELEQGVIAHPELGDVLTASRLEWAFLDKLDEVVAFATYKGELGGGPERNNGEAAVLAWTKCHEGNAIIDEQAARNIAERDDIPAHGSLWLIVNAFKAGLLTRSEAESLVDRLRTTDMWLGIGGSGLFTYAYEEGWLP